MSQLHGPSDDAKTDATALAERAADRPLIDFDDFIDAQLHKTRSHVRSVEIATSMMALAAGTLAYMLLAAVVDHWIVTGGLGFWGRTAFLVVYLIAAGAFLAVTVGPLLVRRIHPLYAAETIERSQPTLKNALVNFLFFRDKPERLSPVVYHGVEEQAARNLTSRQADTAVDRTGLIQVGYALLGILLVSAIYALVSPKDLFRTVGRIAVPWAEIEAPTSTTITEIEPRDAQVFRGQQVTVSARIKDLPPDGVVRLFYTTVDGQTVDRPLEMTLDDDGYKYHGLLPAGDATLQQDLDYRIEAGDAITRPFHLDVVAAPTIFVQAIETKYPAYTGLLAQRVERQGDIKAIEGSQITIEAAANGDIRAAHVDFDCDGSADLRMTVDGRRATATFVLALADDRRTPKHGSYQLVFTNQDGQRNPQPVRHQIEVTRDIPPQIDFVAPTNDPIDVAANGVLQLEVVANDPDFALGLVKISAEHGNRPLVDKLLVNDTHRGQFVGKYRFEPAAHGLKPGDVVTYHALAEDNKRPDPNRTVTARRTIRVAAPAEGQRQQDQLAQNEPRDGQDQQRDTQQDQRQRQGDNDNQRRDENSGEQSADGEQQPDDASRPAEGGAGEAGRRGADGQQDDQQPSDGEPGDNSQPGQPSESGGEPGQQQRQGEASDARQQRKGDSGDGSEATRDQQQSGDGKPEESGEQSSPVASDGSNDGDAIERILKHRDQQQGQQQNDGAGGGEQRQRDDDQPQGDSSQNERDAAGEKPDSARSAQSRDQQPGDSADERPAKQQDRSASQDEQGQQDGANKRAGEKAADGSQLSPADRQQRDAGDPAESRDSKASPDDKSGQRGQRKPPSDRNGEKQDAPSQADGERASEQPKGDPSPSDAPADEPQQQPGDKQGDPAGKPSDEPHDQQGDAQERSGEKRSTEGQGAQAKSNSNKSQQDPSGDAQRSEAKGGDGEQQKGESGAGQKSNDQQGSPSPQETTRPRDKSPQQTPGDEDHKDPNDAQSPSQNQNDSDSQGQDDGDRSGGGKRGGGQQANKPGTGGAGQNTAADEGAGASEQAGDGETSDRAGDDQAADSPTGSRGQQRGKGSPSQQPPGKDREPTADQSQDGGGVDGDRPPEATSDARSTPGGGTPTGGQPGSPPDDGSPAERPYRTAPEVADEANLDYTREATDLALDHLKDQLAKDRPAADLLKDLGWTRDDAERFVDRWQQMRRDAQSPGARGEMARRELDETLKSLGLRPRGTILQADSARDDQFKGLRESRRSSPPPEYAEQVKAYTQGTARGGK